MFIMSAIVVTMACGSKRAHQNTSTPATATTPATAAAPASTTVASICENLEAHRDLPVMLEGAFLGWRGEGCQMAAQASNAVTRSDWLFDCGEVCLYVTGGAPEGFDPSDEKFRGRRVQLRAIVRLTENQKAFLEFVSAKSLE